MPATNTLPTIRFNCILTFESSDQDFIECELEPDAATEHQLILEIGAAIQAAGGDIDDLRKISVCQMYAGRETALPWLMASGGKYFFGSGR